MHKCKNITEIDIPATEEDEEMKESSTTLPSNVTKSICCLTPDTFVNVFGHPGLINVNASTLAEAISICKFSNFMYGKCVLENGQLEKYSLCSFKDYVINQYSKVDCYSMDVFTNICNTQFTCGTSME